MVAWIRAVTGMRGVGDRSLLCPWDPTCSDPPTAPTSDSLLPGGNQRQWQETPLSLRKAQRLGVLSAPKSVRLAPPQSCVLPIGALRGWVSLAGANFTHLTGPACSSFQMKYLHFKQRAFFNTGEALGSCHWHSPLTKWNSLVCVQRQTWPEALRRVPAAHWVGRGRVGVEAPLIKEDLDHSSISGHVPSSPDNH